jgi:hypothetical protein
MSDEVPIWRRKSKENQTSQAPEPVWSPTPRNEQGYERDVPIWRRGKETARPKPEETHELCLPSQQGHEYLRERKYELYKNTGMILRVYPAGGPGPKETSVDELRDMSPSEVETFAAKMLSYHGWDAATTTASGDFGVDVVAFKGPRRRVLQVKRLNEKGRTGVVDINKTMGGAYLWRADEVVFISTGEFVKEAYERATHYPAVTGLYSQKDIFTPQIWK